MKAIIGIDVGSYVFVPLQKQVILLGVPPLALENLALITNVSTGAIIFNFADPTAGATVSLNCITLEYDTTAMGADDRLQIIVNLPIVADLDNLQAGDDSVTVMGDKGLPIPQVEQTGELQTYDTNMAAAMGGAPLYVDGPDGRKVQVNAAYAARSVRGKSGGSNDTVQINCEGMASFTIVAHAGPGTITQTVTVEGAADDSSNFVSVLARSPSAVSPVSAITAAPGVYRGTCAGLKWLRLRTTAYTSGVIQFSIYVSAAPAEALGYVYAGVNGSQTQPLQQRASTYELNTYDTNMAAVFGAASFVQPPWAMAPGYDFATYLTGGSQGTWTPSAAQIYTYPHLINQRRRLAVKAAGSTGQEFAQEANTNKMLVADDGNRGLLEQILMQMTLQNEFMAQAFGLDLPSWFQSVK